MKKYKFGVSRLILAIFSFTLISCKKSETPQRLEMTAPNGQPISVPPGKPFNIPAPAKNNEDDGDAPNSASSIPLFSADHGGLIVKAGRTSWKADHKTWSSWWYPLLKKELTTDDGNNISTLGKFDRFVEIQTGQSSGAKDYQNSKIYDDSYEDWAGYCDARAYAASLHSEPKKTALIDGICFTPEDLKALLVMTYTHVNPIDWGGLWGQPNTIKTINVDAADLFPQEFIRLLQVEIGERKRNLVFDSDPSEEVWTESAYAATLEIQKTTDGNKVIGFLDVLAPSYSLDDSEKILELTQGIGTIEIPFNYTFTLYGSWNSKNQFVVERGEWTGDSVNSHPDFAVQLPENISDARKGANPFVSADWVDYILELAQSAPTCH